MFQVGILRLAACVLFVSLAACSRNTPPPQQFVPANAKPTETEAINVQLHAAFCYEQARKRRVRSMLSIVRRDRTEERYVECMRERGFEPVPCTTCS
jgi:hypothetical protein